jgi:hypothetical protein
MQQLKNILRNEDKSKKYSAQVTIMNKITRYYFFIFFPAIIFGCATQNRIEQSDLFLDPSKRVGEHVNIQGFMHYNLHNRNLFPSMQHVDQRLCLPILIQRKQRSMIEAAKARDGTMVTISGKLVRVAPEGLLDALACKQVGIEVDSIR